MKKHSIAIQGHRTSFSLEDEFYTALQDIAKQRQLSLASLIAEIDGIEGDYNLSSKIRVFVLKNSLSSE